MKEGTVWFQVELNEMISNRRLAELEYKIGFHSQFLQWTIDYQIKR